MLGLLVFSAGIMLGAGLLWLALQSARARRVIPRFRSGGPSTQALQSEIAQLSRRLARLESDEVPILDFAVSEGPAPVVIVDSLYAHALRLAREGMDADTIARDCQLSRGEAELILALSRAGG